MGKKGKKAVAGKPKKLTPKDTGKRLDALVKKLEEQKPVIRTSQSIGLPYNQSRIETGCVVDGLREAYNEQKQSGSYPIEWRASDLGVSKKTVEFRNAVAADRRTIDGYKKGYMDATGKELTDPALSDASLADAYGISRPMVRRYLHMIWFPAFYEKKKQAK